MPLRRVPLAPAATAPHHTCVCTSTQCGASMRIGNGAPSSEANESSGERPGGENHRARE